MNRKDLSYICPFAEEDGSTSNTVALVFEKDTGKAFRETSLNDGTYEYSEELTSEEALQIYIRDTVDGQSKKA